MPPEPLTDVSLTGEMVALRPLDRVDLPMIEEASQDPLIPSITTVPTAADYDDAAGLAFIKRQQSRRLTRAGWSLAIVDIQGDPSRNVLVTGSGQMGLWVPDLHHGRAHLGYWVVPSGRRKGLAGAALDLISGWAFENLDINRLTLYIEPWNIGSIKTAEHAGFEQEALLRNWEIIDGEPKDLYSYVRLA